MKNIHKKIIALAMVLGCVNISAKVIHFTLTKELYQDVKFSANPGEASWDTETNIVTTPSNTIPYSDIQDKKGYSKNEPKIDGYTIIGYYGNPKQLKNVNGVKQQYLLAKP